jgi:hypothetical protein
LENRITLKSRKELKIKMSDVFKESISALSPDLREVLLDDLVTAFENRLKILNKPHHSVECVVGACRECWV